MFTNFNSLPYELRCQVWALAATSFGGSRVIESKWQGTPYYQKTTRRIMTGQRSQLPGLRCRHTLREVSRPLGTLFACWESRRVTLQHNPSFLQLDQGRKIYFNPERDFIYFDLADIYFMYKFCSSRSYRHRRTRARGFDEIVNLAHPRPHSFYCLHLLIHDAYYGPFMPSVKNFMTCHRQNRVEPLWNLEDTLGTSFRNLIRTLRRGRQRMTVPRNRNLMTLMDATLSAQYP